jgi:nucleoside-diphosphate-sugar epimerase
VSAGQPTSVFDVAKLIAVAAGLPQESIQISNQPETGKVREFYPSIEKLKSLGFHLKQPIEQGIIETVNWARNNP